jgi:hypothetical protein
MARTIAIVQTEILNAIAADSTLSALTSGSATAIYRLLAYVVAVAIVTLENIYDLFRTEVDELLAGQKAHTARWYQTKARAFQYGDDLAEGLDTYDNTGIDPDDIANSQIVAYAAVVEHDGVLIVKVNKDSSGQPAKLSSTEYDAVLAYMIEIKDAGVQMELRNADPDKMLLTLDVYYDATILGSDGARLDGSADAPVEDAITDFLKNLPYNGRFVKSHLTDALQQVEGVEVPVIRNCQAARFDSTSFVIVDVDYDPFAGTIRIYDPADLVINYVAYV